MRTIPLTRNLLPLSAAVLLLAGVVMILSGVGVQFAGTPEAGGRSFWAYEFLMGGGALCVMVGALFSWRWHKSQSRPST